MTTRLTAALLAGTSLLVARSGRQCGSRSVGHDCEAQYFDARVDLIGDGQDEFVA